MKCEVKASGKSGSYEACAAPATRASWYGRLSCETHASIRDMKLDDPSDARPISRALKLYRDDVKCIEHPTNTTHLFPEGESWTFYTGVYPLGLEPSVEEISEPGEKT